MRNSAHISSLWWQRWEGVCSPCFTSSSLVLPFTTFICCTNYHFNSLAVIIFLHHNEMWRNTNFCFQDGGGVYKGKQQVMSSSATLTINVIDTQDTPPVFVGTPYFGYVYEVSSPVSIHRNTTLWLLTNTQQVHCSSVWLKVI